MIPIFMSNHPDSKSMRVALEDAFGFLIENSREEDLLRLRSAIRSIKDRDPLLWGALCGHRLTGSIFSMVQNESEYRLVQKESVNA